MGEVVLAVDVGATNLRIAIFNNKGELLRKITVKTPTRGDELSVVNEIIKHAEKLISKVGSSKLLGIGVGTIGPIDIRRGDVVNTPNNPLRNFRLRDPLIKYFNVRTYVVNDCVAAVWGEYNAGIGRGYSNVVYITFSTGIGGGAIVNGNLLLGKDGNAHEIGHIVLDLSDEIKCGCGGLGHWEGIASGSGIPRYAKIRASSWRGAKTKAYELALKGLLRPQDLFKLWRLGDSFANSLVNELAKVNGAGIASVINVYDPEVVSIGGSIALNNKDFIELVLRYVDRYLTNRKPKISLTPLGDDVVLVGAAYLILNTPKELLMFQS